MFRTEPQFQFIQFQENLVDKSLSVINETDPKQLKSLIHEMIKQNKLKDADLYAKKMAIFHGIPGLIYLYKVNKIQLNELQKMNEVITQLAFNQLCYLYLAKELYRSSSFKQKQSINTLLAEDKIPDSAHLDHLIDELCILGNISDLQKLDAKELVLKMLGIKSISHSGGRAGVISK